MPWGHRSLGELFVYPHLHRAGPGGANLGSGGLAPALPFVRATMRSKHLDGTERNPERAERALRSWGQYLWYRWGEIALVTAQLQAGHMGPRVLLGQLWTPVGWPLTEGEFWIPTQSKQVVEDWGRSLAGSFPCFLCLRSNIAPAKGIPSGAHGCLEGTSE
jgi:hypothetical protein